MPRALFSGIASGYDGPAQALSLFQYRRWHRFLLSKLVLTPPALVLDMASGTGALAAELAGRRGVRVVAADITLPMLRQGVHRAAAKGVRFDLVECTAEAAPFRDQAFDAVLFTYLLRYVSDVPTTIQELARLVRPGGTMSSLEFAVPRGAVYPLWRLYTDIILPLGGALWSSGWRRVGSFLGPSIRNFYRAWPEERVLEIWRNCGFLNVRAQRLSFGGAIVIWGTKAG